MKTEHAPLPWHSYENEEAETIVGQTGVTAAPGGDIAHTHMEQDEDEANTEFIVRACNSHYYMLEALKNLENDGGATMPASAWNLVKQAILKATGGIDE